MGAPISADTFRREERLAGVVFGQGQALLDSALNQQSEITRDRMDVTTHDEIGPAGVPKVGGGFEVSVAPDGLDLLVSSGRMYVDGILCINEPQPFGATAVSSTAVTAAVGAPDGVALAAGNWLDVTTSGTTTRVQLQNVSGHDLEFTAPVPGMPAAGAQVVLERVTSLRSQPDRFPFDPFNVDDPSHLAPGAHRVELDVWHRDISPVEDPSIREPALGDAESATRLKVVWQLRLAAAGQVGGGNCAIDEAPSPGRLLASAPPGAASGEPCVLPDEGGYRGLENQLYRVEVHSASSTEVVLTWQRDNASTASRVVALGSTLRLEDMGPDTEHGFASAAFVDVTDEALELEQLPGDLLAASNPDVAHRTIELAGAPTKARLERGAVARRWDGQIVIDLASPVAGQPFVLERGLRVVLVPGALRPGDYWLIPARTANSVSGGVVIWPHDDSGAPLEEPPRGIGHHIASLALVDVGATGFLSGVGNVRECRRPFPPLTAIEATDVGFDDSVADLGADNVQEAIDALAQRSSSICSLLVGPGEDLAKALTRLGAAQDALVCVRVGTYTLTQPLLVQGLRSIQFAGAGPGTRIEAPGSESALAFKGCTSVKVSNMHVSSGAIGRGAALKGLSGALEFTDCQSVTVESTGVECAGGAARAATCITVRNTAPIDGSRTRISGCEITAGHMQTGVLIVNVDRVDVTGNIVLAGAKLPTNVLLADVNYRGRLRPALISNLQTAESAMATNATVAFANQTVRFRSLPALVGKSPADNDWQRAINVLQPSGITTPGALRRALLNLASRMLRTVGQARGGSPRFVAGVKEIIADDVSAIGQAIVVAGVRGNEVSVTGNAIRGAVQGVHVGIKSNSDARVHAGAVAVRSNTIAVSLPASARHERHGVFVGNADSIAITDNQFHLTRAGVNGSLPIDGIRIFGNAGRYVVLRDNHLHDGFDNGVTFAPLTQPLPQKPMWIITDNVMEGSKTQINIPAKSPGHAGVNAGQVHAIQALIIGMADNFS